MLTIVLLLISNTFMTFAWYGHLKHRNASLPLVIVVSWLIAFGEYCFQVPANRIGYGVFTAYQLKIIQESITIVVFVVFAYFYLGSRFAGIMRPRSCAFSGRWCLRFGGKFNFVIPTRSGATRRNLLVLAWITKADSSSKLRSSSE